jgi:CRISPR-associated protein Cas1
MSFGVFDLDRVVDIARDGRHLSRERGFLKVSEDGAEIGRVPLDEIAAVLIHAHGTTCSASLLAELADRGAPVVFCAANHAPRSVLMPLDGHHAQGARLRAQWQAKAPLIKQAWKQVVIAKIQMQAAALEAHGQAHAPLEMMARKVSSGDSTNLEAQAARYYWPLMMGEDFRRNRNAPDINALLNYGYTVLRAGTARAIVAAGLHPGIGLHHSNRGNAFALADDLMEPFRPLVDCAVLGLAARNGTEVDTEAKQALARLIALDLPLGDGQSPVSIALSKLTTSLGQSFEKSKLTLALPTPPDALTLAGLGA